MLAWIAPAAWLYVVSVGCFPVKVPATDRSLYQRRFFKCVMSENDLQQIATHHDTRHYTPIHNILSAAPQWSIYRKVLGKLSEESNVMPKHVGARGAWRSQNAMHHVTIHDTPIHNNLSTAPQLNFCHKALRTLPEDGNVMPKHAEVTIRI
jgi:hypothetical protein